MQLGGPSLLWVDSELVRSPFGEGKIQLHRSWIFPCRPIAVEQLSNEYRALEPRFLPLLKHPFTLSSQAKFGPLSRCRHRHTLRSCLLRQLHRYG